jgi:hydrogenase 3 maturation protease
MKGSDDMKAVVVGVGNELKADDGIGISVARQLQQDGLSGKDTLIIPAEVPENYIQSIVKFRPELLVLIDTADFRGKAGEIRAIRDEEISRVFTNTHSIPLVLFLEAIRKQAPKTRTIFIGIQPKTLQFGKSMSPEVRSAGRKAADAVRKIVSGEVKV